MHLIYYDRFSIVRKNMIIVLMINLDAHCTESDRLFPIIAICGNVANGQTFVKIRLLSSGCDFKLDAIFLYEGIGVALH